MRCKGRRVESPDKLQALKPPHFLGCIHQRFGIDAAIFWNCYLEQPAWFHSCIDAAQVSCASSIDALWQCCECVVVGQILLVLAVWQVYDFILLSLQVVGGEASGCTKFLLRLAQQLNVQHQVCSRLSLGYQAYYVEEAALSQNMLKKTGLPKFLVEVSNAAMRVSAASYSDNAFRIDSLTPAYDLWTSSDPHHMHTLARTLTALRFGAADLAAMSQTPQVSLLIMNEPLQMYAKLNVFFSTFQ